MFRLYQSNYFYKPFIEFFLGIYLFIFQSFQEIFENDKTQSKQEQNKKNDEDVSKIKLLIKEKSERLPIENKLKFSDYSNELLVNSSNILNRNKLEILDSGRKNYKNNKKATTKKYKINIKEDYDEYSKGLDSDSKSDSNSYSNQNQKNKKRKNISEFEEDGEKLINPNFRKKRKLKFI